MTAATTTSTAELMMRGPRYGPTGCWFDSELPRSHCNTPPSQLKYCETRDWLRLSSRCRAARRSGVASRPRIARAGSPSACVATKTMTETTNITTTPSSSRRMTKPVIPPRRNQFIRGAASGEPHGAEAVPVARQVQRPLAGRQALDLGGVAVDEGVEVGDDVAADVVLELLHLVLDLDPLRRVGLLQRLLVKIAEVRSVTGLRRPVGLVVRRGRQRSLLHLVQVAAGAPEVHGEGQLEIGVAVVVRVVLHRHIDPGLLGLGGEHAGQLDHAGRAVRGVEVDAQAFLARLLQQRLGPLDVLLSL